MHVYIVRFTTPYRRLQQLTRMVLEGLFKKKEEEKPRPSEEHELRNLQQEISELELKVRFYKKVIEKYGAMINEYEEKTVPELKSMINRNDPVILELKKQLVESLKEEKMKRGEGSESYVFAEDFLLMADKAFKYCQNLQHIHANLSVSFWLSMKEVIELQAADPFDRAILLCSLIRALEAPSEIRVLELENNLIHPVVICEYEGKKFLLDASQKDSLLTTFSGTEMDAILQGFEYDNNKFLKNAYEFSDEEYVEF